MQSRVFSACMLRRVGRTKSRQHTARWFPKDVNTHTLDSGRKRPQNRNKRNRARAVCICDTGGGRSRPTAPSRTGGRVKKSVKLTGKGENVEITEWKSNQQMGMKKTRKNTDTYTCTDTLKTETKNASRECSLLSTWQKSGENNRV